MSPSCENKLVVLAIETKGRLLNNKKGKEKDSTSECNITSQHILTVVLLLNSWAIFRRITGEAIYYDQRENYVK